MQAVTDHLDPTEAEFHTYVKAAERFIDVYNKLHITHHMAIVRKLRPYGEDPSPMSHYDMLNALLDMDGNEEELARNALEIALDILSLYMPEDGAVEMMCELSPTLTNEVARHGLAWMKESCIQDEDDDARLADQVLAYISAHKHDAIPRMSAEQFEFNFTMFDVELQTALMEGMGVKMGEDGYCISQLMRACDEYEMEDNEDCLVGEGPQHFVDTIVKRKGASLAVAKQMAAYLFPSYAVLGR